MTRRQRTRSLQAAIPLALVLALTGCGSGDDGQGVASGNGGKKDEASSAPSMSRDEEILKYAQCLRKHGLDVADPKPGEGIQLHNDGPEDKEKSDRATKACDKEMPPPQDTEEQLKEEREEMLEMARCMRENGVEKFADPKPGEGTHLDAEIAQDPDFAKAEKKCMAGANTSTQENSP